MKRTLADLQRDAKEREEDELLRAQLVREQANDAAAKKKMAQEEKYCKKWKDVLEKWDDEELKIASELDLTLPESHRLGASLDLAKLGRKPNELTCLDALLNDDLWSLLLNSTNSSIMSQISSGLRKANRPNAIGDKNLLKLVFFARLDMICRGCRTIDDAYKENCPHWYPPKSRFYLFNGNLACDIKELSTLLSEAAYDLMTPGTILVVDESLYEYTGQCPIRRYIPRKPHPNGLLVYCLAGYFRVGADDLPYVLDFEPYTLSSQVSAQDAMMALFRRLRQKLPQIKPHLVVDSAFGSFDRLEEIIAEGGGATMSMPAQPNGWLWELLDFKCGIDQGRLALYSDTGIVVSSFKVLTESGEEHQIKTISSGCQLDGEEIEEDVVSSVRERRTNKDGAFEYLTDFANGRSDWRLSECFVGDDGIPTLAWLTFADASDLEAAYKKFTLNQLRALCTAQGWKPTGDKPKVLKRVVKKFGEVLQGQQGVESLVLNKIGDPTAAAGSSSQLRRFYTRNYPALDRFDRLWYEMEFIPDPRDWQSHFCWSLLHATVVNTRSVWCSANESRVPLKLFLRQLVDTFVDTL